MSLKPIAAALAILPGLAQAQQQGGDGAEGCFPVPEPVVSLSYGSRYTDESADRSDIDAAANAAVNEALGPIDDMIVALTRSANDALEGGRDAARAADCVVSAIARWAEADALSELTTMNANISSPSRVGGMAFAWTQAAPHARALSPETRAEVERWFDRRADAIMQYFDTEAPPGASRNNLRAWAGLAVAAVSRVTASAEQAEWAADTVELVACQADEAGALPLEMGRGPRALHYQVHAVGPLVVSAALLRDDHPGLFDLCDGALHRVVGFVPAAFADLGLVEDRAGEPQTYETGEDSLRSFELAWAEAYLSLFDDPVIADFVRDYRPLGNSKLGGDQRLLW